MRGVPRFDCYPSDFLNGIIGLTADQISVYTVVLMLQYDRGSSVAYEGRERELSVRAGMSRGRVISAINDLVRLGKLTLVNGSLSNGRTVRELEKISEKFAKNAENSEKGGKATQKKWGKSYNENNATDRPNGQPKGRPSLGPNQPPSPPPIKIDSSNELSCPKRVRTRVGYSEDFEVFWKAYPTDAGMAKKEAFTAWQKLAPEDRSVALKAVPAWKAHCATIRDYRMLHACRYLSQRRFESLIEVAEKTSSQVFVKKDSAQWRAWEHWFDQMHGKHPPVNKEGNGWWFKTEWPPEQMIA